MLGGIQIGLQIGAGVALAAAVAGLARWLARRRRLTPEKREQRRRLAVNASGRLCDAMITEVAATVFFYTYSVRGVQYAASQDAGSLAELLPPAPERLIGAAGVKYSTGNPANSILICEEWSGLRKLPPIASNAVNVASANVVSINNDAVGHQPQNAALAEGAER